MENMKNTTKIMTVLEAVQQGYSRAVEMPTEVFGRGKLCVWEDSKGKGPLQIIKRDEMKKIVDADPTFWDDLRASLKATV
jgi:hypothetical protein